MDETWLGDEPATTYEKPMFPHEYVFSENNPMDVESDPMARAIDCLNSGETRQAILAFEAQLKRHEDPETWRILGKILQEQDQDMPACSCLIKAYQLDPKNLDTLLSLSISCTNALEEDRALGFMREWLGNHPRYQELIAGLGQRETFQEGLRDMLHVYEHALEVAEGQDPSLLTCMAVLQFLNRNFEAAIDLFNAALQRDGSNYSLWNKLGATYSHFGRPEQAIDCYHKALELHPNYVRAWANLAIAHRLKHDYADSARFFLNAMVLRPEAEHLWGQLSRSLSNMGRYDLVELGMQKNIDHFRAEFDVLKLEDLPHPTLSYGESY